MLTDIQQAAVRLRDMCLTWTYGGSSGVDLCLKRNPNMRKCNSVIRQLDSPSQTAAHLAATACLTGTFS